jgi:hypothetical protein
VTTFCVIGSASAAVITYNIDEITSSFDISGGSLGLIQANNFESTVFSGSPDVNIANVTVQFNATNPGGSNGGFSGTNTAQLSGDPDFNSILGSSRFSPQSITINGLTVGEDYRL